MASNSDFAGRVLNCISSPDTDRDWEYANALEAGLVEDAAIPPPAVDLREAWWKIGDQGSTGSCVGWAAADSVLRWHLVKAGRIGTKDLLSVRFVWMAAKETDQWPTPPSTFVERAGTSLKAALDVARHYGVVKDGMLPFKSGKLYGGDPNVLFAVAAQLKIAMYFNLKFDLAQWKSWLAKKGPILTRLDVDSTWMNVDQTGKLDLYLPPPPYPPRGHAVAIVGYIADRFIVRNSWGSTWGDGGFAYATKAYAKAAFTEAYGIVA